uniref:Uncharacterized protein n=1 Tax=Myotis myotis TaxID=51298 RepID=A0A7J7VZ36_MYOMY|nr:hypothetical protein mMyoMyo1_012369 [Myotis myotis]
MPQQLKPSPRLCNCGHVDTLCAWFLGRSEELNSGPSPHTRLRAPEGRAVPAPPFPPWGLIHRPSLLSLCTSKVLLSPLPTVVPHEAIIAGLHLRCPGAPGSSGYPMNPFVSSPTSLWSQLPSAPTRSQAHGLEPSDGRGLWAGTSLRLGRCQRPRSLSRC